MMTEKIHNIQVTNHVIDDTKAKRTNEVLIEIPKQICSEFV